MEVLVASVSGGHFPYQLQSLVELCKRGYRPDVSMGGSGGAVAMMCASGAGWTPLGIVRVARSLDKKLFIEEHDHVIHAIVPSTVFNYFRGSMYKSSSKADTLLSTYFTPARMREDEMWIAAINEGSRGVALFCNKSRDKSTFRGSYMNRMLHSYEPMRYYDGDVQAVTKSLLATAAIPMFVKPVNIGSDHYVDCGVCYGSPLTPLMNEVMASARAMGGVHIVYLSGYNIQSSVVSEEIMNGEGNMRAHLKTIPSHVVRSMIQNDRNVAHQIVSYVGDSDPCYREYTLGELDEVLSMKAKSSSSLIEIYPKCEDSVDVFTFKGEDVVEFMCSHKDTLGVRMWYVPI